MRRFFGGISIGLAAFVLTLVPISGAGAQEGLTVTIPADCGGPEFCFAPSTLTITDGEAVTWSNTSGVDHIVARCDSANCAGASGGSGTDAGFTEGDLPTGATFSHAFHGTGTYPYFCPIHGYAAMNGVIVVNAPAPPPSTATTVAPATTGQTVTTGLPTPGSTPIPGATPGSAPVSAAATTPGSAPRSATGPQLAQTSRATGGTLAVGIGAFVLGLAVWGGCTPRRGVVPRLRK